MWLQFMQVTELFMGGSWWGPFNCSLVLVKENALELGISHRQLMTQNHIGYKNFKTNLFIEQILTVMCQTLSRHQ